MNILMPNCHLSSVKCYEDFNQKMDDSQSLSTDKSFKLALSWVAREQLLNEHDTKSSDFHLPNTEIQ